MLDLAEHYDEGCISLSQIAKRQNISKKYLEKSVVPLSNSGLLSVTRGKNGGYQLAKPPEEISLAEVVVASEDGLDLVECISCIAVCENETTCSSRIVWGGLQDAITDYLKGRSLADVLKLQAS